MLLQKLFVIVLLRIIRSISAQDTTSVDDSLGLTCTPFWRMPPSDQGTYFTYSNANTRISGDSSRSICASFRASSLNNGGTMILDIGSAFTTLTGGCNTQFSLSIFDAATIVVFGMCTPYDSWFSTTGPDTLDNGAFHQICATYNSANAKLCIYRDLQAPICTIRYANPYNTGLGDVRIGWWPDQNQEFVGSGGGLIQSASLFDSEISQECVAQQMNITQSTNTLGTTITETTEISTTTGTSTGISTNSMPSSKR
jgi:hypothetical protein